MSRRLGFTLVELLVVLAIIAILAGLLIPVLLHMKHEGRVKAARAQMQMITSALQGYQSDFGRYPPDTTPAAPFAANVAACSTPNGARNLAWFLCQRFKLGEGHAGPYLAIQPDNGILRSPLGGYYDYRVQLDNGDPARTKSYVVIDPGYDRNAGVSWDSTIDPAAGVSRGWKTVTDPQATKDNIYSNDQ